MQADLTPPVIELSLAELRKLVSNAIATARRRVASVSLGPVRLPIIVSFLGGVAITLLLQSLASSPRASKETVAATAVHAPTAPSTPIITPLPASGPAVNAAIRCAGGGAIPVQALTGQPGPAQPSAARAITDQGSKRYAAPHAKRVAPSGPSSKRAVAVKGTRRGTDQYGDWVDPFAD